MCPANYTLNQEPNDKPHSNSLSPEISSQEQLSPEQMSDHKKDNGKIFRKRLLRSLLKILEVIRWKA